MVGVGVENVGVPALQLEQLQTHHVSVTTCMQVPGNFISHACIVACFITGQRIAAIVQNVFV